MLVLAYLTLLFAPFAMAADCSKAAYANCIRIADPLVKEPHLIFPDNMADIDQVCRTWNRFVDCLKFYTDNCFTDQQRKQFNKAVESPIESIHEMCMQPAYQKEYLQYAPCIKSTVTERSHCGSEYAMLVDQVSQGDIISKSTLCCSHDRFKQCVIRETRRLCDRGAPNGPASTFSAQTIDKALSFLQDQCFNYIPNSGDCTTDSQSSSSLFDTTHPISSEIYPWSTIGADPKELPPSRVAPPRMTSTSSWLPSSSVTVEEASTKVPTEGSLGVRTRPASYGRASSWSEGVATASSRPDWATVGAWQPSTNEAAKGSAVGTTTWYPAAGNQFGNEVDEPNQAGWSKPRNGAVKRAQGGGLLLIVGVVWFIY